MQQSPAAGDRHPAAARHVKWAARFQGAPCQLAFEIGGGEFPIRGKSVKNHILEHHERHSARRERGLYWARRKISDFIRDVARDAARDEWLPEFSFFRETNRTRAIP